MITYTYIVKCPECEDEFFDFFDEAKEFALGCLTKKPIITQTEVNRNDFGECTDHCDLGTVWSWEDTCAADEPAKCIFTKDDLMLPSEDQDPEFDNLDNSVDYEVAETSEISAIDEVPDNFRKPIPEGMTIKELVEAMEEHEDTVECASCNDLFDKSTCHKEPNLGWLCKRCSDDLVARGEGVEPGKCTWVFEINGKKIGTVEASTEEEANEIFDQRYGDQGLFDGEVKVYCTDSSPLSEDKDTTEAPKASGTVDVYQKWGNEIVEISFEDLRMPNGNIYTYEASADTAGDYLVDLVTDKDVKDLSGKTNVKQFNSIDEINDYDYERYTSGETQYITQEWTKFIDNNIEELIERHKQAFLDSIRDTVEEAYDEACEYEIARSGDDDEYWTF